MLCYLYRGLMKGGDKKKSAYPSVVEAFFVPSMGVLLRMLFDYNIISYNNGWIVVALLTAGLFVLYQIPTGGFKPRTAADYIFLALFPLVTFCYSFGSITLANCMFDESPPVSYHTTIVDKRISEGKTTTYYLTLEPWGDLTEPEEVKVSRAEYEQANNDDRITITQRKGYFGMPWITVTL
jgi:hypothetical protein